MINESNIAMEDTGARSHIDRITGGLVGLLVGDAMGVPYEFKRAEEISRYPLIEMAPPAGMATQWGQPPGTWSDDGAQALCLLQSLLEHDGAFDPADFGRKLVAWHQDGYMAAGGHVFDVGNQSGNAIRAIAAGRPVPDGSGGRPSHGNGTVMRVLPATLIGTRLDDAALFAMAAATARVTHPAEFGQLCAGFYCLWARRIMVGAPPRDAWLAAYDALNTLADSSPAKQAVLTALHPHRSDRPIGNGEVADCLQGARWAISRATSYEETVRRAIQVGGDTDTTAAVAGGLAGVYWGLDAIPMRWRSALREHATILGVINALRRFYGAPELATLC